ncbi:NAD(P)-dependent oxidoreductase [Streptomyces camelliae]|uniref:NAD(P)-dependent oxidoreductase n=1 Tax=Streptomyces camelliae TaxID=3004093 RepID=A0ABY7PGV0_9ACTN|nr:NAD(P)-dependent oxidoreductase [Streptomyces sp. HUAS 2-6]WBO68755.1 NAD(P)-dependent oxidoreductase [Streptomyces sp. HUAS 2-6]
MSPHPRPRTAVIGLGAMGLPMARRLAGELPVSVYDIAADRRAGLTTMGARDAASPAEAVRDADVVVLAVRDQAQVEGALFGENGAAEALRPGTAVILTSTVGPEAARSTAARLAVRGVLTVDAPVSGGPVRAGNGDLLIVVGAEEVALKAARPVLDLLASTLTVVGPRPGDGQAMKAVNQLLAGVHIAAAAEAIALARGLGLDPGAVVDSLKHGAAGSFMFADRGPRMVQTYDDGPEPEVKSRLDIFVKDMGIVTGIAKDAHVPVPLAAAAEQLYLLGERAGLGARDDSSVVTVLSPKSPEGVGR